MKSKNNKTSICPTPGYVLIEPLEAANKTASGIYLPDTAKEKPTLGKVVAVGDSEVGKDGIKTNPPVKVGEEVFYKEWGGSKVKLDGKEYLFAKFEDILGVYKK